MTLFRHLSLVVISAVLASCACCQRDGNCSSCTTKAAAPAAPASPTNKKAATGMLKSAAAATPQGQALNAASKAADKAKAQ